MRKPLSAVSVLHLHALWSGVAETVAQGSEMGLAKWHVPHVSEEKKFSFSACSFLCKMQVYFPSSANLNCFLGRM
jgi:hypothetical protein